MKHKEIIAMNQIAIRLPVYTICAGYIHRQRIYTQAICAAYIHRQRIYTQAILNHYAYRILQAAIIARFILPPYPVST